jgi:hypothetical protein
MDESRQASFQKLFYMRFSLVAILETLPVSREDQLYGLNFGHKVTRIARNQRQLRAAVIRFANNQGYNLVEHRPPILVSLKTKLGGVYSTKL